MFVGKTNQSNETLFETGEGFVSPDETQTPLLRTRILNVYRPRETYNPRIYP